MPVSNKILKAKQQAANRAAGIGDENGRLPSRVKVRRGRFQHRYFSNFTTMLSFVDSRRQMSWHAAPSAELKLE